VYQESDVCVLTSDEEGTPNVLLEAMACGLPVVATRVGGVPDIIRHNENGFLVDRADTGEMVDSLLKLVNNPALREEMGSRARSFIEVNHSLQRLPLYLENLYRIALS
jgi:glycosyltransferase involved in cell wall biosynthesis